MALKSQSLFLYNIEITAINQYLDFKASGGGSVLTATIPIGFYSLSDLATAIQTGMQLMDTANTYTVSVNRTLSGGVQNRMTIATSGAFLSLLFTTGPNAAATIATTIGFTTSDKTGLTTYTGLTTIGTALLTTLVGYNYVGPTRSQKVFGSVNISTSGIKEAVIFPVQQQFTSVQFKYEAESIIDANWVPFLSWGITQKPFEFTPEITSPSTFYNVTLESTPQSSMGLEFMMQEMIPDFPFFYSLGPIKMRINTL